MHEELAKMYGTNGAGVEEQEEQAKLAHLEMFAKLAAKHGVDLSVMTDEQIIGLHNEVFGVEKTASDDKDEDDKDGKDIKSKEEKGDDKDEDDKGAEEYFAEKKAFQEKFAEADLMGRVMAHAFVQERAEIEKAASTGAPPPAAPVPQQSEDSEKTAAAKFEKTACAHAIKIAEAANYPTDVAEARVTAVYTLGLQESEKIASVNTVQDALHVRGLEYLEAAGYPVNWEEIFGK